MHVGFAVLLASGGCAVFSIFLFVQSFDNIAIYRTQAYVQQSVGQATTISECDNMITITVQDRGRAFRRVRRRAVWYNITCTAVGFEAVPKDYMTAQCKAEVGLR